MAIYLRYQHAGVTGYGELTGTQVQPLEGEFAAWRGPAGAPLALREVTLLAPVAPSKIIAIGPNYKAALYPGMAIPEQPMYWTKPASALNHPEGIIELPPGVPAVNHEVELGIVIGRRARRVRRDQAADYILGYTCVNDVTAAELLKKDSTFDQWTRAKSFDTFGPVGPCVTTGLDPAKLVVKTILNGEERQNYPISDMVFQPAKLVHMISQDLTLLPGDIISCGTSLGVGSMKPGSKVEVRIDGIGSLHSTFE